MGVKRAEKKQQTEDNKTNKDFKTSTEILRDWTEYIVKEGKFDSQLIQQHGRKIATVNIDFEELSHNTVLFDEYTKQPLECLEAIAGIIKAQTEFEDVSITISNFVWATSEKIQIRQLRADHIGKLAMVTGLVRNSTFVIPLLRYAGIECSECGGRINVPQSGDTERIEISKCPLCAEKADFTIKEAWSIFNNFMKCEIEEEPESLKGKQPERIDAEFCDSLTDENNRICIGDRVTLIGIYSVRKKAKNSLLYQRYFNVLGVERKGKHYEDLAVTEEEEQKFQAMSKDPLLFRKFSNSVAPNIYGHETEKDALVLMLFGGNVHSRERRGDIHILLIGDPGVGKSKILKHICEVAPHSMKASGAPTTTVGLTACTRKDDDAPGGYILEAGAAVLADGGLLAVDEFDKMDKEVRGAMHEIMEDQKCTVTKANLHVELQSRCSVLAIMNPMHNKFIEGISTSAQINLPPSLLSRFDLIFAIKDKVEEVKDRHIADAMFRARTGSEVTIDYELSDMTKYISYSRSKIREMTFSKEAQEMLTDKFWKMRNMNRGDSDGAIAITPRQLEGAARLAEAHAKMRLSSIVEKQDAIVSIDILNYYLTTMAMNADGIIDVGNLTGSTSKSDLDNEQFMMQLIEVEYEELVRLKPDISSYRDRLVDTEKLKKDFVQGKKTEKTFDQTLDMMMQKGKISLHDSRRYVSVKKERDR